jgi:hypothetical protein
MIYKTKDRVTRTPVSRNHNTVLISFMTMFVTRRLPHVEQELLTLLEHLISPRF